MIYGIGTDIVRVSRIERDLERFGDRFAEHILSESELEEFHQNGKRAHFLARRFAAKEAAAKALGTGFGNGLRLRQISVTHDARGKPELRFSGKALEFVRASGITMAHISLADEQDHALAFVAVEAD